MRPPVAAAPRSLRKFLGALTTVKVVDAPKNRLAQNDRQPGGMSRALGLVAAIVLTCTGCGSGTSPGSVSLTVLAASSLTESFTGLAMRFEKANTGVEVELDFESSSSLARKVTEGAPADVLATADEKSMATVVDAAQVKGGYPVVIARNRLEIAVANGNPRRITGLPDLGRAGITFVLCAPQVPCGSLGARLLAKARVTNANPVSLEENVKAALAKVVLGEVDAALVYTTDVRAAGGKVLGIQVENADDPDAEAVYSLAVLEDSSHAEAARRWVAFIRSDEGQAVLRDFGFHGP
jgi:molybdate transport system substrate-binding protein